MRKWSVKIEWDCMRKRNRRKKKMMENTHKAQLNLNRSDYAGLE